MVHPKRVAAVGLVAAVATSILSGLAAQADGGLWLRVLFLACWLVAAVMVAWRGEAGVSSVMTVVFLVSFPIAYSGVGTGHVLVDQAWHAVGSVSLLAFLYLFPRGQFEPRWTTVTAACSATYLAVRAFRPDLSGWPGDLFVFPSIMVLPLCLQVVRFKSASNPIDRYRLQIVGLTSVTALLGQLILFGLLMGGLLGPVAAAESFVEPISHALALLLPAGVTLAMVPLHGRAKQLAEYLTASGDDAQDLIGRLNTLAQSSTSGRDLLPVASEVIRRSLRLPSVSIELDGLPDQARDDTDAQAVTWPLSYRGVRIGALSATPRRGGPLSVEDQQMLHQLSVELAAMVAAVHLAEQLDEARKRLLNVREEERRLLRADLHDELGATLAGLTLKAGLARALMDLHPDSTRRLLSEIEANLQNSVVRVRELVQGLRPAQLDELGLDAAIREQAEQLATRGSIEIRVQGHAHPGLPAAVELAAYRIAQEALTNAVRHSGGSQVDVELVIDAAEHLLTLRVTDNGIGLRDAGPLGFGLQSMRQRAREVGGDCVIRPGTTGGLVVTATLPLTAGGI